MLWYRTNVHLPSSKRLNKPPDKLVSWKSWSEATRGIFRKFEIKLQRDFDKYIEYPKTDSPNIFPYNLIYPHGSRNALKTEQLDKISYTRWESKIKLLESKL